MKRKSYGKRRYRRTGRKRLRRSRGRRTVNVNRSLQPFSQRYIAKMKYSTQIRIQAAVPLGSYKFLINSIYDPDNTGVGHQPYGHDTLESIYNRYRVISCRYRITGTPTATGKALQLAVLPSNDSPAVSDMSAVIEGPRAKYTCVASNETPKVISGKVNIPSLFGRTRSQYMADDRYQADMSSSPAENAWLIIYAQDMNPSVTSVDTYVNVMLKFYVECFDVKQLSQS